MKQLTVSLVLTDEQYAALERITEHYNAWARDMVRDGRDKDAPPLSPLEYLAAWVPGRIIEEDRDKGRRRER